MDYSDAECRRVAEESRSQRRSIADALDVVRAFPEFNEFARQAAPLRPIARVRVGPIQLPSGKLSALIDVIFPALCAIVSLPTASSFEACADGRPKRRRFPISELDNAEISADGTAVLNVGMRLTDVIITRPTRLPYAWSKLDLQILRCVIAMTGSYPRCTRDLRRGVPRRFWKMLPAVPLIDYSAVSKIRRPPIKAIKRYLYRDARHLKNLSHQKIADALGTFGIR